MRVMSFFKTYDYHVKLYSVTKLFIFEWSPVLNVQLKYLLVRHHCRDDMVS